MDPISLPEPGIKPGRIKARASRADEERPSQDVLVEASVKEAAPRRPGVRQGRLTANRESQSFLHRPTHVGGNRSPTQEGPPTPPNARKHVRFRASNYHIHHATRPPILMGRIIPVATMRRGSSSLVPLRHLLAFPEMGTEKPSVIGSTSAPGCCGRRSL